mmetsp:Transcript_25016/g.28728  ORF Transcript_25016/g.28728 Transcript_25016/m.28728 type:complete len:178 (+) Transcript_25016:351-884(+)
MCGGIDTLVSQAFGRKDYYLCGVYLNTARLILVVLAVLQTLVLVNCRRIFELLEQPADSAEVAQQYILAVLPGLFLNMQFECLRRFLLVQGVYNPILYILVGSLLLHMCSLYVYLILLDLRIVGVAVATATTYSINFIALTLYVHLKKNLVRRESWHCFDLNSVMQIPRYLRFGLPS